MKINIRRSWFLLNGREKRYCSASRKRIWIFREKVLLLWWGFLKFQQRLFWCFMMRLISLQEGLLSNSDEVPQGIMDSRALLKSLGWKIFGGLGLGWIGRLFKVRLLIGFWARLSLRKSIFWRRKQERFLDILKIFCLRKGSFFECGNQLFLFFIARKKRCFLEGKPYTEASLFLIVSLCMFHFMGVAPILF